MNSVTFSGRVGQDPTSNTVDDQPVTYLTVYENRRTRRGTEWVNDSPNVWRVEAHGELAELTIANITKGNIIVVTGEAATVTVARGTKMEPLVVILAKHIGMSLKQPTQQEPAIGLRDSIRRIRKGGNPRP